MMPVTRLRSVGQLEYEQEQSILAFENRLNRQAEWLADPFGYLERTRSMLEAHSIRLLQGPPS